MSRPIFWCIAAYCLFVVLGVEPSQAVETIVVGGDDRPWSTGGGDETSTPPALTPQFRLTPRTAGSGNTPGGIIDFDAESGWIVPTQIDPERNLFQLIREQGGSPSITSPNVSDIPRAALESTLQGIIDGSDVVYVRKSTPAQRNVNPLGEHIDIDLGARFGIERIRFYPSVFFPGDFIKAFELKLNDGSPASLTESGNPLWTLAFRNVQNNQSDTNVTIPLQFVRHLRLTSLTTAGFEIDELELYGRGYVPTSRYLSDIFDLGEKRGVWGQIRWEAEPIGDPAQSRISVRTRTGSTQSPLIFTRMVISRRLSEEPFRFALDRITYDRATVGVVLAPVEVPEQSISPDEYSALEEGIRDWLELQGTVYSALDEAGDEQAVSRADYLALDAQRRGAVSLVALQIPVDTYRPLPRSIKDWLAAHGAQYFRRANIGEAVPYDFNGVPIAASAYNRLPPEERGPMLEDTENWSPWSAPYPAASGLEGTPITSPAPRRYLQFEIAFESENLEAAHRVDLLSLEVSSPPVAQRLVAEIFPREVQPGQSVEFTYAVRPTLDSDSDLGFDNFEIQTPVPIQQLLEIQILDPEGQIEAQQVFGEPVAELSLPFEKGDFTLVSVDPDRFRVRFPKIETDGALLKMRFVTSVLRFGTTFDGRGISEGDEGLPQPAFPGNVASLGEDDAANLSGLTVFIDLTGKLISDVLAVPNPFTPNGDGINDRTEIRYDVLKLTEPTPVKVDLYTLAGRRVRTLQSAEVPSGRYAVPWDAKDETGRPVPPGLYMFRIKVESDLNAEESLGTIAVVY